MIEFRVLGVPAPQGSKTRMPNGAILEGKGKTGREKHRTWRTAVAEAAHAKRHDTPLDGPLYVRILQLLWAGGATFALGIITLGLAKCRRQNVATHNAHLRNMESE